MTKAKSISGFVSSVVSSVLSFYGNRRGFLKQYSAIFILLAGTCFVHSPAAASSWQTVEAQVLKHAGEAEKDAQTTRTSVREEKEKLLAELSSLKEAVKREEEALQMKKDRFESLLRQEEEARTRLESEEEEAELLEGIIRSAAKDAEAFLRSSPITAEFPSRPDVLAPLIDSEHFPALTDIRNFTNLLFQEMKATGEIRKRQGTFVDNEGKEVTGEILHIGPFTTFYRSDGATGYLRYDENGRRLVTVPGKLPWFTRKTIKKYFDEKTEELPLDLSGGVIFEQFGRRDGTLEWLRSGGILVWPILFVGLLVLVLALERLIFLERIRTNTNDIFEKIQKWASKKHWKECRDLCTSHSGNPTCKVLQAGLENRWASKEIMENALQETMLKEIPRLERFLSTISVLAAIAPLLGLLGTVSGMINTFRVITVYGTGDPRMMSGGISEALITTELGLAVAIPALLIHHFLERRVDQVVADMEEKGTALTVTLIKNEHAHDGMVDHAA